MKTNTHLKTLTSALVFVGASFLQNATAVELLNEDFSADDGGFTVTNENHDDPWAYDAGAGAWSTDGSANGAADEHTRLTSPELTVDANGSYVVIFDHRYDIEGGDWDGAALYISVNGGSFRYVEGSEFTENGYNTGDLVGAHALGGLTAFGGISPGHAAGTYIKSTAGPFPLSAGDTVQIQFLMANDQGAVGTMTPNWEINEIIMATLEDTDGDGMPDFYEDSNGLNRLVDDSADDPDMDLVSNLDEYLRRTDPQDDDSDDDELLDGVETGTGIFVDADDTGTNPLSQDSDGDTILDGVESNSGEFVDASDPGTNPNLEDSDGDGFTDSREIQANTDPTDPASFPTGSMIAAYSFDDGTATDLSGNGFDGVVVGAVPGEGVFGDALVFDGSDASYVTTPDFGAYDELTVACWIKVTGRVGAWRALYNVDGWSAGWLHHQFYPSNLLGFSINANAGGNDRPGTTLFDDTVLDTWHHVATVYSSIDSTLKFYVNGVLDTEHSWGGNPVLLGAGRIGAWSGGGRGFQGPIDEMVFLDYAASADQVADIMESGLGETRLFQVTDISLIPGEGGMGNEVVLNFTSRTGKIYAVDRSTELDGNWLELEDGVPGGDGSTEYRDIDLPDTLPTKLFYRVREQD